MATLGNRHHDPIVTTPSVAGVRGSSANGATTSSKWGAPPKGYVPGLGRGASGFTTRSDIGNSTMPVAGSTAGEEGDAEGSTAGGGGTAAAGGGGGAAAASSNGSRASEQRTALKQAAANAKAPPPPGDPEDDEADQIWQAIDDRMQAKANRKKRKIPTAQDDPAATARAKIGAQFRELKQELASVSEADWLQIPEVGDHSLRHKQHNKSRQDTYTPLTDSLLETRATTMATTTTAAADPSSSGAGTGTGAATTQTLQGLGAARGTVLGMSLDKMSDSVSGQTVVDPQGYLTSMASTTLSAAQATNVGDIQKARLLLKSVRDANPNHGPGWIAAARVEEAAGKLNKARKLIQEGCQVCGGDQPDVWLEAARLHPTPVAKSILATAVRRLPTSVPLYIKAAELEVHDAAKKAVFRKALEANPTSLSLWKAAIDLEDEDNAKVLLAVAVEKCPTSVDLWLALARLESYDNARKVLNQARRALPTERQIWMAAAQLEEGQHHDDIVKKIVHRAFMSLEKSDAVVVTREQWLEEAEQAERAGAPKTSAAIVQEALGLGILEEDRQRTWSEDAKGALRRGAVATGRSILAHSLSHFPTKRALWRQAVDLEQHHGTQEDLDQVLKAASDRLPRVEFFWLLRAKEQWLAGQVDVARDILTKAFDANPDSEQIWLAAAKLEWETGETERARVLLQRARDRAPTDRVYMKSALLERQAKQYSSALDLIQQGLDKYPKFTKFYMMAGQIYSEELLPKSKTNLEKARKIYQKGLTECPNSIVLWILSSRLEENAHQYTSTTLKQNDENNATAGAGVTKARSLLELARLKNPKTPELWLEAVRLERRSGNMKLADSLMARALQECPTSGLLLAETILTAPKVEQKSKSTVAIKRCQESPLVIAAVATLFSNDRKTEKARKWLERSVVLNPDLGDSWARYYAFELEFGTADQQKAVKERCIKAEPKHGMIWQSIVKDMANVGKNVGECLELVTASIREEKEAATIGIL